MIDLALGLLAGALFFGACLYLLCGWVPPAYRQKEDE